MNVAYCDACQEQYQVRYNYVYQYKDHLGNIRMSYGYDQAAEALKVIEENHYYPYGLKHTRYNTGEKKYEPDELNPELMKLKAVPASEQSLYKYKYNGKEWQDELSLNMYDYGARNYDPAIGRWMNIDPLAEMSRRYSPYTYALDNPVYFIDPDGMLSAKFEAELMSSSKEVSTWTNNGDGTLTSDDGVKASEGDGDGGPNDTSKKQNNSNTEYKKSAKTLEYERMAVGMDLTDMVAAYVHLEFLLTWAGCSFAFEAPATVSEEVALKYIRFPKLAAKFAKHAKDWSSIEIDAYYEKAISLANSKVGGKILGFTSEQGWIFRMNAKTGEFLTINPQGEITTFFRALKDPLQYWATQIAKYGK